jgi:hypothetical protein
VAHNVATSTACDMGTDIALNATDPNNDALTFLIQSLPAMGSLSDPNAGPITGVPYTLAGGGNVVHYVPPAGTNPPDTFTFSAQDATAESNTATVTVTIGGADWDPVAHNVSASTGISLPVNVTLNGTDPNSDPLAYVIEVLPAYGYLADPNGGTIESVPYQLLAGGNVVMYQPPCGLTLADDFGYCVHDATATSNSATADVTVNADDPRLVYDFPMDTNPGWSMEGDWAFGQPTGGGTHNYDPTSGHTGDNVLGYNLSGDYPSRMPEYALTTTALDCSNLTEVELRFWRWLGVEAYDTANVEVSNDGANWQLVWENPSGSNVSDASWMLQTFDISAYADHQPTVYLRWNMGPTDSSVTFPGWNIDDVQIWALVPPIAADFNGDGLVTLSDHDVLCGCLAGPQVETPLDCMCIDLDGDADVDLADFAVFQQDMVTP